MSPKITRAAFGGALLLAGGFAGAAVAQPGYDYYGNPVPPPGYRHAPRPLTVARPYAPVPRAYDPYHGPQAIVTAPLAAANTLVALPFHVVNAVFPPYGNPAQDPRVIVGAPVHAAGQIATLPIRVLQAPFGGYDYTPF